MTYKLFLDDTRDPIDAGFKNNEFVVVRSMAEALSVIEIKGFPNYIAYDHDLGWDELTRIEAPTGFDFAKWLINQDLDNQVLPKDFAFSVHSANPAGAANIRGLMESYLRSKE
jgi:hypothetical protein